MASQDQAQEPQGIEKGKPLQSAFPTSPWPAIRSLILLSLVIIGLCYLAYAFREPSSGETAAPVPHPPPGAKAPVE